MPTVARKPSNLWRRLNVDITLCPADVVHQTLWTSFVCT